MSLKISTKATQKQLTVLKRLEYYGTGNYAAENLSIAEAAELIDELFEEQRLENNRMEREFLHEFDSDR